MVLPIEPIVGSNPVITREKSELILKHELQLMQSEGPTLEKYRDYYDGDQKLVFGTEKFKEKFGDAFKGFRDNWSAPVVDALVDKILVQGLRLGTNEDEIKDNTELSREIWNIFRRNDIDEQQLDLHEGAAVEGRSYMIVWPDQERDVRLDWQPADLMRVRYADDDSRKIIWAMKRWLTPSGEVYITVYTQTAIYKYIEPQKQLILDPRTGIDATRPTTLPSQSFDIRRVEGETWPLNNPFNIVPVVEFMNKRESELHDVIPLQDGVNYLMLQGLTAAGFQGFPQRVFFSGVKEPVGGWSNEPGRVWQIPPDLDPEGKLQHGSMSEFRPTDFSGIKSFVEMVLQHMALQTKTPVRMFFQSDRGGRGDAPSGESLLVEDQPLLDKVEDRQARWGNAWYRVALMVARMSKAINMNELPLGEVWWKDPRSKYRTALVSEGAKMVKDMGMPLRFVIRQLGFTADEIELAEQFIEEDRAEKERQAQQLAEQQAQQANSQQANRQTRASPNPSSTRSGE